MPARDTLMLSFQAKLKRKPPRGSGGYQHWLNERHSGPAAEQILHDGAPSPAGTGPFRRPRRGRTRPTPGSVSQRQKPTPS